MAVMMNVILLVLFVLSSLTVQTHQFRLQNEERRKIEEPDQVCGPEIIGRLPVFRSSVPRDLTSAGSYRKMRTLTSLESCVRGCCDLARRRDACELVFFHERSCFHVFNCVTPEGCAPSRRLGRKYENTFIVPMITPIGQVAGDPMGANVDEGGGQDSELEQEDMNILLDALKRVKSHKKDTFDDDEKLTFEDLAALKKRLCQVDEDCMNPELETCSRGVGVGESGQDLQVCLCRSGYLRDTENGLCILVEDVVEDLMEAEENTFEVRGRNVTVTLPQRNVTLVVSIQPTNSLASGYQSLPMDPKTISKISPELNNENKYIFKWSVVQRPEQVTKELSGGESSQRATEMIMNGDDEDTLILNDLMAGNYSFQVTATKMSIGGVPLEKHSTIVGLAVVDAKATITGQGKQRPSMLHNNGFSSDDYVPEKLLLEVDPPTAIIQLPHENYVEFLASVREGDGGGGKMNHFHYKWTPEGFPIGWDPREGLLLQNGTGRIRITNLTPGSYRLRVVASSSELTDFRRENFAELTVLEARRGIHETSNGVHSLISIPAGSTREVYLPVDVVDVKSRDGIAFHGQYHYQWTREGNSPALGHILGGSDQEAILKLTGLVPGRYSFKLDVIGPVGFRTSNLTTIIVHPNPNMADEIELFTNREMTEFTERDEEELIREMTRLLTEPQSGQPVVELEVVQLYSQSDTGHVALRFVGHNLTEGRVIPGRELIRRLRLALNRGTQDGKSDLLTQLIVRMDLLVCQSNCSGHGTCDQRTRRCSCDILWLENPLQIGWGDGETNCDWSVAYIMTSVAFLGLVLSGLVCLVGHFCVRVRRRMRRRSSKSLILIRPHGRTKRFLSKSRRNQKRRSSPSLTSLNSKYSLLETNDFDQDADSIEDADELELGTGSMLSDMNIYLSDSEDSDHRVDDGRTGVDEDDDLSDTIFDLTTDRKIRQTTSLSSSSVSSNNGGVSGREPLNRYPQKHSTKLTERHPGQQLEQPKGQGRHRRPAGSSTSGRLSNMVTVAQQRGREISA